MADTLYGMKKLIIWARSTNCVLTTNLTDTATTLVMNTAEGNNYNTATTTFPHKICIDSEIMYVTNKINTTAVTISRARDGTANVAHTTTSPAVMHLTPVRVYKVSEFTITPDIQTISIPGDGTVESVFSTNGIRGTLTENKWTDDVLQIALGATLYNTNLDSTITSQLHPQLGTYPLVQMDVDVKATDGDNSDADITRRIIIWKGKLQNPFVPGAAGNNALMPTQIQWSANPTTTDLFGIAIKGATADVHYTMAKLA